MRPPGYARSRVIRSRGLARMSLGMADVVLPVLDEREALPWVLGRIPAGYDPIVVDNGSSDGSGALAARLGARVVHEPQAGFGAACWAGLAAATADLVCFMDCDASLDPVELPRVADPVARGSADLVLGARAAQPGAWPAHARVANAVLARELRRRAHVPLRDLGPDAGRAPGAAAGAGDRGPALRLAAGDGAARRRGGLADRRGHRRVPAAGGPLEGDGDRPRHAARGARHGGGPRVSATLLVIAKEPVPGRVKTRLCPPCTPAEAAALAAAALADTLAAADAAARGGRRVLALDGRPGQWLPAGWEVVPQRGDGLAARLASAFADVGGPAFLVGMDTPQVTPAALADGLAALDRAHAALGPAFDGGYWGIGLRRPIRRSSPGSR